MFLLPVKLAKEIPNLIQEIIYQKCTRVFVLLCRKINSVRMFINIFIFKLIMFAKNSSLNPDTTKLSMHKFFELNK